MTHIVSRLTLSQFQLSLIQSQIFKALQIIMTCCLSIREIISIFIIIHGNDHYSQLLAGIRPGIKL